MLDENFIIQKSIPLVNELRKSKLDLQGFKLIEVYLSKINSHKPDKRTVTFTIAELEKIYGNTLNASRIKETLQAVFDLEVSDITADPVITETKIKLFELSQFKYNESGIQEIILQCSESAMQYIFNIEELRYLRYKLRNVAQLTKKYSYQLFMYLLEHKFQENWIISISELIETLNAPYNNYYELNRYILKPCINEINELTSLKCDYYNIRRGQDRTTKEIGFIINSWAELEKVMKEPEPEPSLIETAFTELAEQEPEQAEELDSRTALFMDCFDGAFTIPQVQLLIATVNLDKIEQSQYGADIDKYNHLRKLYKRLIVEEQEKKITNRFKYFLSMVENYKGGEPK